jgi:hypothetical protein
MNGQNWHIHCHLQTSPKTKQAIFTVPRHVVVAQHLPESCQNWRSFSLVVTAITLSIVFLPPISDTCKSHVNVHGHVQHERV